MADVTNRLNLKNKANQKQKLKEKHKMNFKKCFIKIKRSGKTLIGFTSSKLPGELRVLGSLGL